VTLPLVLLAIPSVVIGWFTIEPLLFGGFFGDAIQVAPEHDVLERVREEFHGSAAFVLHGFTSPVIWLAFAGVATAWFLYLYRPGLPARLRERFAPIYTLLDNKYYFDAFNEKILAAGGRALGHALWRGGDVALIDGAGRQRLGATGRLGLGGGAQSADGLSVSLRVRDDRGLSVLLAWLLLRT
jgi:NADH-quinone oxidoreductase subunit L